MGKRRYYFTKQHELARILNLWDIAALCFIFAIIIAFGWAAHEMAIPYQIGQALPISLDPNHLPSYAARTVLRMLIALCFSLLFTFTIGTWAAKSRRAEQVIIPLIDILQSVPVLSFLSITIAGFILLFPNSLLGPECASIFAIFTSQVWNMTLGFYQTVRTVPHDLREAADMLHLRPWQRFWRIEVPFSMPGLLWNTMMSMSASWFFVVATEAISVSSDQIISLPGIGSYIALAISHSDLQAVGYAILAMIVVILMYDQLLFRPLNKWSEKFTVSMLPNEKITTPWVMHLLQHTRFLHYSREWLAIMADKIVNARIFNRATIEPKAFTSDIIKPVYWSVLWYAVLIGLLGWSLWTLLQFIMTGVTYEEITHVFLLGLATAARIVILILISSLIWVPVGVWVGQRPQVAQRVQPLAQLLAAFPANLLFPIVVVLIVRYQLNVDIWTTPLIILGSQWYILFNVIAGATTLPKDLYQAADNLGLKGWLWWRRLALPGIFPYFVTGAITAAGGAWNASIVAELVSWGDTTLHATGLGEYIARYSATLDYPRIALGTGMMCLFVLLFNRVLWRPLYRLGETRFQLS